MKKLICIFSILGLFIFLSYSCEEDEKNEKEEQVENVLLGTWIEEEPYTDGICDTIIFKEDYTIGLYYPITGWEYNLVANDSLLITNPYGVTHGFNFTFIESDKLLIYNFLDRSASAQIKNITFNKILI